MSEHTVHGVNNLHYAGRPFTVHRTFMVLFFCLHIFCTGLIVPLLKTDHGDALSLNL